MITREYYAIEQSAHDGAVWEPIPEGDYPTEETAQMAACELVRECGFDDLRVAKYVETETTVSRVEVISYIDSDAFND